MKQETFKTARARLISELSAMGWTTKPHLKTPWAEKDGVRLSFHPQAIYCDGHSLFIEMRSTSVASLLARVDEIRNNGRQLQARLEREQQERLESNRE